MSAQEMIIFYLAPDIQGITLSLQWVNLPP